MCRITFLIFEGLSSNKACSFSKSPIFKGLKKKSLKFSTRLKFADGQGCFSRLLKSKCGKGNRQKIVSGVYCDTLPSGKIRTLPVAVAGFLDLITVGGILANVPRWEAS